MGSECLDRQNDAIHAPFRQRAAGVSPVLLAALCLAAGTVRGEGQPPGASTVSGDDGLVARWPAENAAQEQSFDGNRFVSFAAAPDQGQGPFSVSTWVNADDLSGGDPQYGRGIARSTRSDQVGDWLL